MAELVLQWDKRAVIRRKKRFEQAQRYVDEQCVERMREFVPVGLPKYENSGALRDSAEIPERGKIIYTAKFARHDYYAWVNHRNGGNPNAQRMWFEAMKGKYRRAVLRGTAKIIGGRGK